MLFYSFLAIPSCHSNRRRRTTNHNRALPHVCIGTHLLRISIIQVSPLLLSLSTESTAGEAYIALPRQHQTGRDSRSLPPRPTLKNGRVVVAGRFRVTPLLRPSYPSALTSVNTSGIQVCGFPCAAREVRTTRRSSMDDSRSSRLSARGTRTFRVHHCMDASVPAGHRPPCSAAETTSLTMGRDPCNPSPHETLTARPWLDHHSTYAGIAPVRMVMLPTAPVRTWRSRGRGHC